MPAIIVRGSMRTDQCQSDSQDQRRRELSVHGNLTVPQKGIQVQSVCQNNAPNTKFFLTTAVKPIRFRQAPIGNIIRTLLTSIDARPMGSVDIDFAGPD